MTTEEDMLRLHAQVRFLEDAVAFEAGRGNRLADELAKAKADLESLRASIYSACAGTGCLNAHELRAALDHALAGKPPRINTKR